MSAVYYKPYYFCSSDTSDGEDVNPRASTQEDENLRSAEGVREGQLDRGKSFISELTSKLGRKSGPLKESSSKPNPLLQEENQDKISNNSQVTIAQRASNGNGSVIERRSRQNKTSLFDSDTDSDSDLFNSSSLHGAVPADKTVVIKNSDRAATRTQNSGNNTADDSRPVINSTNQELAGVLTKRFNFISVTSTYF